LFAVAVIETAAANKKNLAMTGSSPKKEKLLH
jgi:hypothetical protein